MNTIRRGSCNVLHVGHSAVGGVLANDSSKFECCLDIPPMRIHMARTTALSPKTRARLSVQRQSNSRGWLHRVFLCKPHQVRHLCDYAAYLQSRCSPS
jgi:hypothetical protein